MTNAVKENNENDIFYTSSVDLVQILVIKTTAKVDQTTLASLSSMFLVLKVLINLLVMYCCFCV